MYMLEKHYREMSDRIDMSQVLCVNISNAAEWFYSDAKNIKRIKTDDGESWTGSAMERGGWPSVARES